MRVTCIMVPVEYSEHCRRALEAAGVWADRLGARLEVIHVWDHPPLVPPDTQVDHPGGGRRSLFELIGENAEKEMLEFVASAKLPAGVTVTHHLETGEPVSAILAAVAPASASLSISLPNCVFSFDRCDHTNRVASGGANAIVNVSSPATASTSPSGFRQNPSG